MSWTETTRLQYRRKGLRYSSDMLDAEWALIAPFAASPAAGAAAGDGAARGGRGDLLHRGDRLPVADAAEGVSTLLDSAAILLPLARHRHLGADQSYFTDAGARGGGARSQPIRRGNRQPIGQDHRGGRPARVRRRQENQEPAPAQAGGRKRHIITDTGGRLVGAIVHGAEVQSLPRRRPGTATARFRCWPRSAPVSRGCATFLPMPAMPAPSSKRRWPSSGDGRSRSSSVPRAPRALPCCRGAGWSSAPSPGSTATAGWPKILKPPLKAPLPG
jgi:hypothetical protein